MRDRSKEAFGAKPCGEHVRFLRLAKARNGDEVSHRQIDPLDDDLGVNQCRFSQSPAGRSTQ